MQIIAQIQGTPDASQAITVNVNEPTTVQVKLDKYVSVGGMLTTSKHTHNNHHNTGYCGSLCRSRSLSDDKKLNLQLDLQPNFFLNWNKVYIVSKEQ